MNDSWEDNFSTTILGRGWDIYFSDDEAIHGVHRSEDGYEAVVDGSMPYDVKVFVDEDGDFVDASCTCPYASDGRYCKHEAALLYAISNGDVDEDDEAGEPDSADDLSVEQIVERMDRNQLAALILELAEKYESVASFIQLKSAEKVGEDDVRQLNRTLKTLCHSIEVASEEWYDEFNDHVETIADEIAILLDGDTVAALLEKGQAEEAFLLARRAWKMVPFDIIDEQTDIGSSLLTEAVFGLVKKAWANAGRALRDQMSDWFKEIASSLESCDDRSSQILHMILETSGDPSIARDVVSRFQEMTDRRFPILLCDAYRALGDEKAMWDTIMSHLDNEAVFQLGFELVEKNGDADETIAYLEKVRDFGKGGKAHDEASKRLLFLYKNMGMTEKHKEALLYHVTHVTQIGLVFVHELKSLCDEAEWSKAKERIIKAGKLWNGMADFLLEEEEYEALMDQIERGLLWSSDTQRCLKLVYPHCPERVVAYASRCARNAAADMRKRSHYQVFAAQLSLLRSFETGKRAADEILADVLNSYPSRPALRDELRLHGIPFQVPSQRFRQ